VRSSPRASQAQRALLELLTYMHPTQNVVITNMTWFSSGE
jgi:hypothetical protein